LLAAGLIILVGVYLTRYKPPRELLLTVGNERFHASDVVDRGTYFAGVEGRATSAETLAKDTLDILTNEAVLRQNGPAVAGVGDVTADDVQKRIAEQLGVALEAPTPEPSATPAAGATASATPTATATATATATGSPTPEASETATPTATASPADLKAKYATEYQKFLQRTGIKPAPYEQIVRAQIVEERLRARFNDAVGDHGPQIKLSRIRVNDFALAQSIHQQIVDGGDFAKLHDKSSTGKEPNPGGDIGWTAIAALPKEAADAVRSMKVGETSGVVKLGLNFDIYQLTDEASDRPYDAQTRSRLVSQKLQEWLDSEKGHVTVQRNLSSSEERWANEHILARARAISQQQQKQQQQQQPVAPVTPK
jgi:hypothetical protein